MKIKKIFGIKKLLYFVLLLSLFTVFSLSLNAASTNVSITGQTVTEGGNVSVTIKTSSAVSGVNLVLTYDTSSLDYVSYSGGFGGGAPRVSSGSIIISETHPDYKDEIYSITLTFKALKVGTSQVKVTAADISDKDGESIAVTIGSPATVTVKAKPTASSDATLKSLSVSPGSLSPSFSASVTKYSVSVANRVTSIAVSAGTNHSAAKYTISGNTNLGVGNNIVTVKVTAQNGATKTYTINVKRAAAAVENPNGSSSEQPEQPETPEIPQNPETPEPVSVKLSDGTEMNVAEFEDSLIPPGFERKEITVNETAVSAISCLEEEGIIALYLVPSDTQSGISSGFYYYDIDGNVTIPVYLIESKAVNITVLNIGDDTEAPDGYKKELVTIGENIFYAFIPEDKDVSSADNYIVYAVNSSGKAGLYVYDTEEATLQRYGLVHIKENDDIPPIVDNSEENNQYPEYVKWIFYAGIVLAVLFLAGFIIFAILYSKTLKSYKKLLAAKKRAAIRRREKQRMLEEAELSKNNSENSISDNSSENFVTDDSDFPERGEKDNISETGREIKDEENNDNIFDYDTIDLLFPKDDNDDK